jgi:hypothetical protein
MAISIRTNAREVGNSEDEVVGDRSDPEYWLRYGRRRGGRGSIGGRQRSVKGKSKSVGIGVGATAVYYLAMFCFPRQK